MSPDFADTEMADVVTLFPLSSVPPSDNRSLRERIAASGRRGRVNLAQESARREADQRHEIERGRQAAAIDAAFKNGRGDGHADGHREGFRSGTAWGIFLGVFYAAFGLGTLLVCALQLGRHVERFW